MASAADRAAQNFTMPALSPTMTEGNIANWRIKEGETFTAGDVLLEIETDKATMDVEAQDDGIMFKIIKGGETKGVKVGERIAVTAEEGDDISTLEIPAEKSAPAKAEAPKPQEEEQKKPEPSQPKADAGAAQKTQGGKAQKQKYPLYPAVQHLLKASGLPIEEADKIPASGPNGRLLKGDVLAYIGKVSANYPSEITARLLKLSHLDLSNIQLAAVAPPPKAEKPAPSAAAPVAELPKETEVALPISLTAVIATQQRVQEALGISLPLSTFVARATELANESLPASKNQKPTAEDLFNSVLGLDSVPRSSRGSFLPNITALGPAPFAAPSRSTSKPDIIDLLSSKSVKPARKAVKPTSATAGPSVFSVSAQNGEEKRAMEFLERMKLVLEQEPGRLVL